jgi:hypothetical protein
MPRSGRDTYEVVVNTCGPATPAAKSAAKSSEPPARAASHDLAAALVDLIEDGPAAILRCPACRGDLTEFGLSLSDCG